MAASSRLESMVPDTMLLAVALYLDGTELMCFERVSKKIRGLKDKLDEVAWQAVCHRRWRGWPRYRWTNLQQSHQHINSKTWKQRYLWVERDFERTRITVEELETRLWYFNFTTEAGGRGSETLRKCSFGGGAMHVPDFPPLHYWLVDDGRQQTLCIHNFLPHIVERLASNGEWVIKNRNITCVSSHDTEALVYRDRGFQT